MTTRSYSVDLRIRVIKYILSGNSQRSASHIFKVSISAIGRWYTRYKVEKNIEPKPRGGSIGKISPEELQKFVVANCDKTLSEIGLHFGVSNCAIHKRLKSLGFSYKKKSTAMWKQIKKREINT